MSEIKEHKYMKWLALFAVLSLYGCQEAVKDPTAIAEDLGGAVSKEKKTFAAQLDELKPMLEKVRKATGWKITCAPELEKEIIYLRFKDKNEVEVARVLADALAADADVVDGALTLTSSPDSPVSRSVFQKDVMDTTLKPEMEALAKASASMSFAPGRAREKIEETARRFNEIKDLRSDKNQRLLQMKSPAARTAVAMFATLTMEELMNLGEEAPVVWSTAPKGNERPFSPSMEKLLEGFVAASMEWNAAMAAANARLKNHYTLDRPTQFNPRGDFEFRVERVNLGFGGVGEMEIRCWLAGTNNKVLQPLQYVPIPLDYPNQKAPDKEYPEFDKEIRKHQSTYPGYARLKSDSDAAKEEGGPAAPTYQEGDDIRVMLLTAAIETANDHADNICANLTTEALSEFGRLVGAKSLITPAIKVNPEVLLLRTHTKKEFEGFVQYRPHFVHYVRLDRAAMSAAGYGIYNSPWGKPPKYSKDEPIQIE